jgi:hypothetical protein
MLSTKSVYSPIDRKNDGLRILVTRIRGRGLKKNRYHEWMANLGPSERLLGLSSGSRGQNSGAAIAVNCSTAALVSIEPTRRSRITARSSL